MTERATYFLKLALVAIFLANATFSSAQFYSGTQMEFGKNRVQYRDFNWLYYPYNKMEVYFYQGGEKLAEYALMSADKHLKELEGLVDYGLQDEIQLIVYNKQSEFRQSNIGLTGDDQNNIGGSTRIIGSKVFVYFEGDYAAFDRQIRGGIARILLNQMMYGGDWKDVFKSSTLLSIPEWYEEGFVSYIAEPWSGETEAFVVDGILSGQFDRFNRLEGLKARYAGHGIWKYIADVYGEGVISNILYMTRVSRNIENGFLFVLGVSLNTLTENYREYYWQRFKDIERLAPLPEGIPLLSEKLAKKKAAIDEKSEKAGEKALSRWNEDRGKELGNLPVKLKGRYNYDDFRLSPDGRFMAYTTDEMGQYKVWLYEVNSGKLDRIYKREYRLERISDDSFPIIAWHPSGKLLSFIIESKGRVFLVNYTLEEKKIIEKELFRIDKVIDMNYSADGKKIIFSGVKEGQTDLFLYYVLGNKQDQLTNDPYDDLNPCFTRDPNQVIFVSNRPDDTLRTKVPTSLFKEEKDVFILNLEKKELEQITQSPELNEFLPYQYDKANYTFLGEKEGNIERYRARVDSSISRIDTTIHYRYFTVTELLSDYGRNPLAYDFNSSTGDYTLSFRKGGGIYLVKGSRGNDRAMTPGKGIKEGYSDSQNEKIPGYQTTSPSEKDTPEIDISNYRFEDEIREYEYEKETVELEITETLPVVPPTNTDSKGPPIPADFALPKSLNYQVNFATDYVLSQIDNTFTNRFYQPFTGPTSVTPGLSGLIKLGISDLFEDYKIVGGFRLSGSLDNNDYGLRFENLKSRMDKIYSFQRQSLRRIEGFSIVQYHTHTAEYQSRWPINELKGVRMTFLYRNDRSAFLSTDMANLAIPNVNVNNLGIKLEYVFDNTISKGLNLFNGTRYKLFAEYYQEPGAKESDFSVFGLDMRHYQRIHRDLILAIRAAGSTSLGSRNLVYFLGGVDNWLFQKIDNDMPIADDQNYVYQALASPMRGFFVNSRNGNSFATINTELRWPIFKYFLNKPIKSDFVENFQLVGFSDVGSAWTGLHPYSEDNRFNTQVYEGNPITVTIENNREPIVYGYGFGLRSRVLGYFVRADWAWGVDDGVQLPRVFYLSLNLDF